MKARAAQRLISIWFRTGFLEAKRMRGHHLWCTLVTFFTEAPTARAEALLWKRLFETTPRAKRQALAAAFRGAKRLAGDRIAGRL